MDTLSGKLAAFTAGLTYKSLPPEIVQKAKQCLMDTLGAALAGSKTPEALMAKRLAQKLSQKKEATLLTAKGKVGVLEAALANGIMSHALELDDGNRYAHGPSRGGGHPRGSCPGREGKGEGEGRHLRHRCRI